VNNIDYLSSTLFGDDVLELNGEPVKLTMDVLMIYYNDQDKEVYVEIIHFYEEDEEDPHILLMINIIDDYDFLIKQRPKFSNKKKLFFVFLIFTFCTFVLTL
jgi:lipoprotein NlpI